MADEIPAAPVAAAPADAPAVQPAPAQAPASTGFTLGSSHLLGGVGVAGITWASANLVQPLVHWAVTGGAPSLTTEQAASVLITGAAALALVRLIRGRGAVRALFNGATNAKS